MYRVQKLRPRRIPVLFFEQGRKFAEFYIEMEPSPSAMERVLSVFEQYGVDVKEGAIYTSTNPRSARVFGGFLDITDSRAGVEELKEVLESLEGVYEVDILASPFPSLAVCAMHYPLTVLNEECVVFRRSTWEGLLRRLHEKFSSAANIIMYQAGIGTALRKDIAPSTRYALGLGIDQHLNIFRGLAQALGWGRYEIVEVDHKKPSMRLRMYQHFECEPFRGTTNEPRAHFMRGHLEASFKRLFGKEFRAKEVLCVAKGDPYCEIVVEPLQ